MADIKFTDAYTQQLDNIGITGIFAFKTPSGEVYYGERPRSERNASLGEYPKRIGTHNVSQNDDDIIDEQIDSVLEGTPLQGTTPDTDNTPSGAVGPGADQSNTVDIMDELYGTQENPLSDLLNVQEQALVTAIPALQAAKAKQTTLSPMPDRGQGIGIDNSDQNESDEDEMGNDDEAGGGMGTPSNGPDGSNGTGIDGSSGDDNDSTDDDSGGGVGDAGAGEGDGTGNSGGEGEDGASYSVGGPVDNVLNEGSGPEDGYISIQKDEFVINKESVAKYGQDVLEKINNGEIDPEALQIAILLSEEMNDDGDSPEQEMSEGEPMEMGQALDNEQPLPSLGGDVAAQGPEAPPEGFAEGGMVTPDRMQQQPTQAPQPGNPNSLLQIPVDVAQRVGIKGIQEFIAEARKPVGFAQKPVQANKTGTMQKPTSQPAVPAQTQQPVGGGLLGQPALPTTHQNQNNRRMPLL